MPMTEFKSTQVFIDKTSPDSNLAWSRGRGGMMDRKRTGLYCAGAGVGLRAPQIPSAPPLERAVA